MATFKEISEEESTYFNSIDSERIAQPEPSNRIYPMTENTGSLRRGPLRKKNCEAEPGLKY